MFGYMQSVTDKAARCDSLFSRNGVLVPPLRCPDRLLLQVFGERSQVDGQICSPESGFGLLRSVSQRLLSTIGAGAGAGGAAGRERGRERDEGVGALTATPSRRSCMDSANPRACARPTKQPREAVERSTKESTGARGGGGRGEGGSDRRK